MIEPPYTNRWGTRPEAGYRQCAAWVTKAGTQCRRCAAAGSAYCHGHMPDDELLAALAAPSPRATAGPMNLQPWLDIDLPRFVAMIRQLYRRDNEAAIVRAATVDVLHLTGCLDAPVLDPRRGEL